MTREEAKSILGDVRAYLASLASLENELLAGHSFVEICNAIKALEQEPKIGYWIDTNDQGFEYHRIYKCSNCECTVCAYPEEIKRYKFCYGCGSRNEVEQ